MTRTNEQNARFYTLLSTTHLDKDDTVFWCTAGRTYKSSEMSETEMDACLDILQEHADMMNQQRRRIFSCIRSIHLLSADDKLGEDFVMRYIRNIVGLKLEKTNAVRLNDYTSQDLKRINKKLDAIKPKQASKWRKQMKAS